MAGENISYMNSEKELIVLAAPLSGDLYYANQVDAIFNFHIEYVNQIKDRDNVLIFVDENTYDDYVEKVGEQYVVIAPMLDIWMRDFSLSNVIAPVMFRYTAAGQGGGDRGQKYADTVQEQLATIIEEAELEFKETKLLNDGGNFVDDYHGNVVISTKFLRDNNISEKQARSELQKLINIKHVAFINSDEQGGLEHADGVVAFVDKNTVIINSYGEEGYLANLRRDLQRGLPDVVIHEIITPYDDSEIHDRRFSSACGLYTNALVTPKRVYLPQFDIPQDKIAIQQVQQATTREVVPVPSHYVCSMGGGVRCMSWQLRGQNASKLLEYFN